MSEHKPCPFCEGGSVVRYSYKFANNIYYQCCKCGCLFVFDNESKDTWNTRPAEDALEKEVERLKAEVERLKIKAGRAEGWLDSLRGVLQRIINVTSPESQKELAPEETVKWINNKASYAIEVMNKCYELGKDTNAIAYAPDAGKMDGDKCD